MYKRIGLILIIGMFLLSGCSPASSATSSSAPQAAAPSMQQRDAANMPAAPAEAPGLAADSFTANSAGGASKASESSAVGAAPQGASGPADTRLVIRNANLTIVVEDPGQAMNAITRMVDTMQGYVVTSNLYKTTTSRGKEVPQANITIRVPAAKLNQALDQVKKLVGNPGTDIITENISGQDVTKEYTDLQSREKNLEQAAAQLKEIIGSATKTEDVLAVYNQLNQVQEQIEVLKGQIKYYEESAAMSSIAVVIQAQAAVQPLEIAGWQPVGVARNAVQSLINTMQVIGTAAIWLILYILPVALLIFIPLRLLWWLFRRGQKNRPTQSPTPPATPA